MRVVIGADHAGVDLKKALVDHLKKRWPELAVEDVGTQSRESCDYPDFAERVASRVSGETDLLGILVCGSGQGMAMAANRRRGIRASVCGEPYSARISREHNGSNVLCLGARVVGPGLACEILDAFLNSTPSNDDRHRRRIAQLESL